MNTIWETKSVLGLLFLVGAKNYSPLQQNTIFNHSIIITTVGKDLCLNPEIALVDYVE
jgi:hypothetical protein